MTNIFDGWNEATRHIVANGIKSAVSTNGTYILKPGLTEEMIMDSTRRQASFYLNGGGDQSQLVTPFNGVADDEDTVMVVGVNTDDSMLALKQQEASMKGEYWPISMEDLKVTDSFSARSERVLAAVESAGWSSNRIIIVGADGLTPYDTFHAMMTAGVRFAAHSKFGYGYGNKTGIVFKNEVLEQAQPGRVFAFPLPNDIQPTAANLTPTTANLGIEYVNLYT